MYDGYAVHARADGEAWIEMPGNSLVLAVLRELLAFSRLLPIPWHPIPVLWGTPGSGKTAVAKQLIREARGAVQCRFGCPGLCMPARRLEMDVNLDGDAEPDFYHQGLTGPRRTTLVFVEDADALLRVSKTRRAQVVADLRRRDGVVHVFVGTYELMAALRAENDGNVQDIHMPGMSGRDVCAVAEILFRIGRNDRVALERLDSRTERNIGRMIIEARRSGHLDELARETPLPALAALPRRVPGGE